MFVLGLCIAIIALVLMVHSLWLSARDPLQRVHIVRSNWADVVLFSLILLAGIGLMVGGLYFP